MEIFYYVGVLDNLFK